MSAPRLRRRSPARLVVLTHRARVLALRLVAACLTVVAIHAVALARCGDRPADEAGLAAAVGTATGACPCDDGVRSQRCLRDAIRHVRLADGLRTACRHVAFVAAVATPCTAPTLTGRWRLTGEVIQAGCGSSDLLESLLIVMQDGARLTAQSPRQTYIGTVQDDGWQLYDVIPPLDHCPLGEPAEMLTSIRGTLPDASGVATVEQTIVWSSPVSPYDPCPGCAIRWQGTMVRE